MKIETDYEQTDDSLEATSRPSTPLDEDQLLKAIQDELSYADTSEFEGQVVDAIDYYNGDLPAPPGDDEGGPPVEYADYVSREVQNAIEATIAEIMPGFYGDQPVTFVPLGPHDEGQAMAETRVVNHVVMTTNRGYMSLQRAFKDALLAGSGFTKAYWSDKREISLRRIPNVPVESLATLLESGQVKAGTANDDGTYTVDIAEERIGGPTVEWLPSEQVIVNPDHNDVSLDTARFVCHARNVTASDIVAFGLPKELVDELAGDPDVDFVTSGLNYNIDTISGDDSTRPIAIRECYYRVDMDGDGIAELRRIITAGGADGTDRIISEEPWPEQPIAHGVAYFNPRGWRGLSLTDRLKGVQDYKSDLMRQIMDAGWRNLNQRLLVLERMVNMDDLMGSRRGGTIRVKDINAIQDLPNVQVAHQSFQLLEVMNQSRRESGGGAIDTAPQSQEIGVDSAHGLERIMSAIEQTGAMAAKNLAETLVASIYIKVHALLRRHWPGIIQARNGGTWIEQVPHNWVGRDCAEVTVGLSTGTRLRQAGNIAQIIQQQDSDAAKGLDGILVDANRMYAARVDFSRLVGVNYPDKYWIDPQSEESKAAAENKAKMAAEQSKAAQAEQEAQRNLLLQIETIKANTTKESNELKAQMDQYKANLEYTMDILSKRIELIDMNAKYDKEPVPNSVGGDTGSGPGPTGP